MGIRGRPCAQWLPGFDPKLLSMAGLPAQYFPARGSVVSTSKFAFEDLPKYQLLWTRSSEKAEGT